MGRRFSFENAKSVVNYILWLVALLIVTIAWPITLTYVSFNAVDIYEKACTPGAVVTDECHVAYRDVGDTGVAKDVGFPFAIFFQAFLGIPLSGALIYSLRNELSVTSEFLEMVVAVPHSHKYWCYYLHKFCNWIPSPYSRCLVGL